MGEIKRADGVWGKGRRESVNKQGKEGKKVGVVILGRVDRVDQFPIGASFPLFIYPSAASSPQI